MKKQSQEQRDIKLYRACITADVDGARSALAGATRGALNQGLRIAASLGSNRPGGVEITRFLIEAGADLDWRSDSTGWGSGLCPLHEAAVDPTMMRLLLDAGADPNVLDEGKRTPLHHVMYGADREPQHALDNVRLLLEAGIDVKAVDDLGRTALDELGKLGVFGDVPQGRTGTPTRRATGKVGVRILADGAKGYESICLQIALLLLKAGAPAPREPSPFVAMAMDALAAVQRLAAPATSRQRRRA